MRCPVVGAFVLPCGAWLGMRHVFLDAVIKGGMVSQFVQFILKGDKERMYSFSL
jgi:hypothetical protein